MDEKILFNLEEAIRLQMEKDRELLNNTLKSYKIVITILEGMGLKIKLVERGIKGERKNKKLSEETVEKIKLAKKILKNNINLNYLFTLLAQIEEYSNKIDIKNITTEAFHMLSNELNKAILGLSSVTNLLTKKGEKNE